MIADAVRARRAHDRRLEGLRAMRMSEMPTSYLAEQSRRDASEPTAESPNSPTAESPDSSPLQRGTAIFNAAASFASAGVLKG